jgi:prefoldin subunit 4
LLNAGPVIIGRDADKVRVAGLFLQQEKEYLDDLSMELELADEDEPVRYKIGDAFVHMPLDKALERISTDSEKVQADLDDLKSQMDGVQDQMTELKKHLYGKFGNSINLEKD